MEGLMSQLPYMFLLALGLYAGWLYGLWNVARSSENAGWKFSLLFMLPLLASVVPLVAIGTFAVFTLNIKLFVFITFLVLYLGMWGYTAFVQAGEDELMWFLATVIFFPIPIWMFYWFTKIR